MTTTKQTKFSPVNIEERQKINITSGDTVRVWQKIQEKGKTRLQPFEGMVLMCKHGKEAGATFTVRKISGGVGIEKTFPLYSPMIDRIEVTKRTKVRRSKLYYIREKVTKEIRRQMRRARFVSESTSSEAEETPSEEKDPEAKTKTENIDTPKEEKKPTVAENSGESKEEIKKEEE